MKTLKYNQIAMLTGITGQDGSYLAELLLSKGYTVVGLYRRSSSNSFNRISSLINNPNLVLEEFDLTDPATVSQIVKNYQPNEFYNLAAQSHVGTSFKQPSTTMEINATGVINILEAIKSYSADTKFYQASTSEMYGRNFSINPETNEKYQDETTEFMPQSPYGVSKLAAHRMVQIYRDAYGLFGCSGILFNHESPRRGENFVTRKITNYIGQLTSGINKDKTLKLGNINIHRDWGHAKDYVRAMWLMLQQNTPDDYVIASGFTRTVLDFLKIAFRTVDLDYKKYVEIDPTLYRPAEVDYLQGSSMKAQNNIGWFPEISFNELIEDMVFSDIKLYSQYK
jgi:GDPmannose 4,6-dehydratase